jgi:hypothetical protein
VSPTRATISYEALGKEQDGRWLSGLRFNEPGSADIEGRSLATHALRKIAWVIQWSVDMVPERLGLRLA